MPSINRKLRRTGTGCAYCGRKFDESVVATLDHVPPECLFPRPRPNDLITVPACTVCHSTQTARDDEYFRAKLSVREGATESAQKVAPEVYRGLMRPQAAGFRRAYVDDFRTVIQRTPAGFVLPRPGYHVSYERLLRVVERIARGLHFHISGSMVGATQRVGIYPLDELRNMTTDQVSSLMNVVLKYLFPAPLTLIGRDVFAYRCRIDLNAGSLWQLSFYGNTHFVVMTAEPPEADVTVTERE